MTFAGPDKAQPARVWRFLAIRFDEGSWELSVDGTVVEVERKPLEVLRVLLERAGKVVTKEQLAQLAWPGRIIGDAALAKSIARLREAIGDRDHEVVRTHHRYGYRLMAGVRLEQTPPPLPVASTSAMTAPAPAEHRVLTMLFCDLVDSTHMAESLEPEVYRSLLLDYQRNAADIARRYEGHVAQQFGDGLLFWFGYPDAHDDDAERALRCACELLHFAARAASYTQLALRIGVHTGPLVVGHAGGEVQGTGANLNIASRIQALAEPNSILASDATFRLVPGLFVTRDFGPQALRGIGEPVRVHQILQPSGARSRLDVQPYLTPFAGREDEIAQTRTWWDETREGSGRAILFRGEPGLGKSRLLLELRAHLASSAHTWLEARAHALHRHAAFHVAGELLRRGLALNDGDDEALRMLDLERRLDGLGLDADAAIPLLAPLLNLPESADYPASALSPEQKRARLLEVLVDWIAHLADEQPLVLVVEDLHWCDDSTLEFIGGLLARMADLPLLLVMTARPEFVPSWPENEALHTRTLEGLPRPAVERMLADLAGPQALPAALAAQIVKRAGGVPLFVEELTRSLLESGSDAAVPDTLNAVLRARLDRLGAARELIQTAAVIGLECPYALLQHVAALDAAAFDQRLARLTDAGLLLAQGAANDRCYTFKHALIRDSAYATLLKSTRQRLHERAAQALESLHTARLDDYASALAHHCEQAGQIERAARFAQRAGELAMQASANREAATLLATAIRLDKGLEATRERTQNLILLHANLGVVLTALNGYTDADAHGAYQSALALSRDLGPTPALAPVLAGLCGYYVVIADYPSGLDAVRQLDALGKQAALPTACIAAQFLAGQALYSMGRFEEAERALRASIALYDAEQPRDMALVFQEDARSGGGATLAVTLASLGQIDESILQSRNSLQHARRLRHPFSLAIACTLNAVAAQVRRDVQGTAELARECIALSSAQSFPFYVAWAEILLGWCEAQDGVGGEAVTRIRTAVAIFNGNGAEFYRSWALLMLAEAQGKAATPREGLVTLAGALEAAVSKGERPVLAEIHRLRGELILQVGDADAGAAAKDCFLEALEVSRGQGARTFELRAATSLARLFARQGRTEEAVGVLGPVYRWFRESVDTPDLLEAGTLLANP